MSASSTNATLSPQSRERSLEAMRATSKENPLDVLVIGGGVTGAGIVLDAVTRGLDTAIVEAQDWASGTSSRSSKLIHGGLRYLQMLDFSLVHEALTERDLLLNKLAPHLAKPVPFLFPLIKQYERPYIGAGIMLYDILASLAPGKRAMPFHKHYSRKGMKKKFPSFRDDAAVGAIEYWDGTIDDARLVLTLVRTAASYGAHAASRTQVIELTKSGAGRVNGAVLKDLETGRTFTVHAKHVINSTGVWTEETEDLAGGKGGLKVLASKGIHIVVPRDRIKGTSGLILQTEKSVLFVIPWSRYWIIGTTDTPWKQDFQHPVATKADIDYVLEHANAVLADPLTPDDIIGTYAGLRPLLQPEMKEGTSSAKVSREHTVAAPAPGFTVIAGGKLTTYRVMAEDAVDFALGAEAQGRPSVTNNIPLLGAVGLAAMANQTRSYQKKFGWSKQMIDHLLHRYGSMINEIVAICNDDPSMAQPVAGAEAYLRAEIHYAVTREGVLHLEDILLHRTRINYEFADRGLGALEDIASIAAAALGWDKKTTDSEIASYKARAAAEEAAENEPDDTSAEKVRLEAADLSPMEKLS